jgi:hypothetical protein
LTFVFGSGFLILKRLVARISFGLVLNDLVDGLTDALATKVALNDRPYGVSHRQDNDMIPLHVPSFRFRG